MNFLQGDFEALLDNLPLATIRKLRWFQQDGAPAHNSRAVIQYLNRRFGNRWIGTHGPVRWPPRSPGFNPLDYFLWGLIKNKVYNSKTENIEQLRQKIIEAFQSVRPEEIRKAVLQSKKRARLCLQENGRHFEQLLT